MDVAPVAGSKRWTRFPALPLPPNRMISLPIETAAASCAAIGREPTRLAEPVRRSIERIVEIDESPGISPPSM